MRNIIRGAVEVLGYDFIEAEDGEAGLAMVKENSEDIKLIMLDVNMPGMLGTEVLDLLKEDDTVKDIPVMMVTTEIESKAIIGAIRAGAANYVTKPFGQEELVTKMVETLGM
jgi:two-component system chemotaxis response regulator CheY